MSKYLLEIAAFTIDGVLHAIKGGADRIELCENPQDGGTTPSYGMLQLLKRSVSIPVFPIVRPRGGDFVYSEMEFDIMKTDILLCKELGYPGVVLGILNEKGEVDKERTTLLVSMAGSMQVTFHRAFDRTADPFQALEDIIECGCTRILSSGQFPSANDGKELLSSLVVTAGDRIIIMPGSGLNSDNVKGIATFTKANEFHTAARKKVNGASSPSTMNETLSAISVDEEEVRAIRSALDLLP